MSDLIEFYGTECPHCKDMDPIRERLEKEEGIKIRRLEVWHNEKNAKNFVEMEPRKANGERVCGGVPFFLNLKTGKWICGSTDYESFKKWAKGKQAEE